ncbi:MAG: type II secretion system minor pseudopilin GspJ [Rudaea sp.]
MAAVDRVRATRASCNASRRGFSLIELLVALAVFATMAGIAWGALDSVARTRAALARSEDDLRSLMLAVGSLQRELRQAVARPVRGNYAESVAGFLGSGDRLEFSRLGFANPLAERRSNLERVAYAVDGGRLIRASYPVLDRAAGTQAVPRTLREHVRSLRLRYLDADRRWIGAWPVVDAGTNAAILPLAVEIRLDTEDYGEITAIVELVADFGGSAR